MIKFFGGFLLILLALFQLPNNSFIGSKIIIILDILILTVLWFMFAYKKFILFLREKAKNPFIIALFFILTLNLLAFSVFLKFDYHLLLKSLIIFVLLSVSIYFLKPRIGQHHWKDIIILIYFLGVFQSKLLLIPMIKYKDIQFNAEYLILAFVLLWFYVVFKEIDIGFHFDITWQSFKWVLIFTPVILFVIILGLKLEFVVFSSTQFSWNKLFLYTVFMLYYGALIEELFFRGLIFNYVRQFFNNNNILLPILISSLFFGLTHLFNFPYQMVILSFIAGVFYCLTYIKSNNLFCASVIHTLMNLSWKLFFVYG